jgi:hypothetical protein
MSSWNSGSAFGERGAYDSGFLHHLEDSSMRLMKSWRAVISSVMNGSRDGFEFVGIVILCIGTNTYFAGINCDVFTAIILEPENAVRRIEDERGITCSSKCLAIDTRQ